MAPWMHRRRLQVITLGSRARVDAKQTGSGLHCSKPVAEEQDLTKPKQGYHDHCLLRIEHLLEGEGRVHAHSSEGRHCVPPRKPLEHRIDEALPEEIDAQSIPEHEDGLSAVQNEVVPIHDPAFEGDERRQVKEAYHRLDPEDRL